MPGKYLTLRFKNARLVLCFMPLFGALQQVYKTNKGYVEKKISTSLCKDLINTKVVKNDTKIKA